MRLLAFEVISLLRRVAADGALERRDLAHVICKLRRGNEARLDGERTMKCQLGGDAPSKPEL